MDISLPAAEAPSSGAALSPSRVSDYRNCPLKFRFLVIDRLHRTPSAAALRGTIVHAVLEHLFDLPPQERTNARARAALRPTWEEHLLREPESGELFADEEEKQAWLDSALPLLDMYFHLERPQFLNPAAREKHIRATIPAGLAIRGIIDRIDRAPNGDLRIVDYKTGKSPAPRFGAQYLFQMNFYVTAVFRADGILAKRTQLIFLKNGRVLTYDPTMEDVLRTEYELEKVWEKITHDIASDSFLPRESPLCHWCEFRRLCPALGGTAPQMSESGAKHLLGAKCG